ncbi:WYL domain-containing protein [Streptomyces sp. 3MP-14]|uniref:WYL domain-containing protein n=1 Tax=Streptomyces mimosae TaxID=2586635 RepID=A0A5N6AF29_9ACTN|nr:MULTISPECIES: WYL domain-containing protein [Streptomyces]KAB8167261.1 WYL domain-containing protein [Streptomyces mimosae]KAB8177201.1 WYL domain-containing protein [Streptomyces sp. 3MP-14]
MADVTGRMLALLATLQTGRAFTGAELARLLGVSRRTLRRDVERLRGYGYPVATRPGPGGHYRLAAGRGLPPLVLDDDEAVAALLGVATLAASASGEAGGLDDAARRAYGKLDQLLPARPRSRAAALRASLETGERPAPGVEPGALAALAEAIAERETVTFAYRDARGADSRRRVEPHRQVHLNQRWYLLGWDLERADWRVFRTDRIEDLLRTGAHHGARTLPAETALGYLRAGLNARRREVRLVVEAPLARVADALRHEDARLEALGPARTRATLGVDSWEWLPLPLAFLDADFRVEGPPEILAGCATFARRLLAATDHVPGGR